MHVFHGTTNAPAEIKGAALAIGNFDGVHRGHQALIARARERAQAGRLQGTSTLAGAMVFEPHPREFFHPERPHFRLSSLERKVALFERYSLDLAVVVPFDAALASLDADQFIEQILVGSLAVRHVVIGYDFFFGKGRNGDAKHMQRRGAELGFGVSVIPPVAQDGEVISSSAIRAEIAQGDVAGAAHMLGHWWMVGGEVVGGYQRGTGMGFPTANLVLSRATPLAYGIYAVFVDGPGGRHQGAAYLGTRPTFDNGPPVLEVFLFDFDGDLYGKRIEVSFVDFIRPDRRFDGMDALIEQMNVDCEKARVMLDAAPSSY